MKITFTRNTGVKGKSYAEGDTADVDDSDGRLLVGLGKAVRHKGEEDDRESKVMTRDPQTKGGKSFR